MHAKAHWSVSSRFLKVEGSHSVTLEATLSECAVGIALVIESPQVCSDELIVLLSYKWPPVWG